MANGYQVVGSPAPETMAATWTQIPKCNFDLTFRLAPLNTVNLNLHFRVCESCGRMKSIVQFVYHGLNLVKFCRVATGMGCSS